MHAVTLREIDKSFGSAHILKSLSMDIDPGDFVVLLGSSGCGKSTLLSLIAGLEDPDSGSLYIGDRDVTDLPPKARDIAMVFQSYALYPTMTVRENMSFGLRMAKVARAEIAQRVEWASRLLKLEAYLERKPGQLSGGQRQRVAIGRAIVRKAPIYLFDEPLSNLDAKLRAEMRLELKRLHEALGATMIYVTHDQIEAMTMATKVALMREGRIEQFAAPEVLYNRPASRYVAEFVGTPAINILPARLDGSGLLHLEGCPNALRASTLAPAQDVTLGLRPEHLHLRAITPDGGPGQSELLQTQAKVEVVEFTGADAVVWLQVPSGRICVRVPSAVAPEVGAQVDIHAETAHLSVFSRESGLRL